MLKKSFAIATLLLASTAHATPFAVYVAPSVFLNDTTSSSDNQRQLLGRISLGMGSYMNKNYYAGAELFVSPGGLVLNSRNPTGPTVKNTWNFGASVLPGVRLNENTMLFFRLGAVDSHFTYRNNYVLGGQFGIGLSTTVAINCDVRGEYIYTAYRSMPNLSSPRSDWYGIGLVFRFD